MTRSLVAICHQKLVGVRFEFKPNEAQAFQWLCAVDRIFESLKEWSDDILPILLDASARDSWTEPEERRDFISRLLVSFDPCSVIDRISQNIDDELLIAIFSNPGDDLIPDHWNVNGESHRLILESWRKVWSSRRRSLSGPGWRNEERFKEAGFPGLTGSRGGRFLFLLLPLPFEEARDLYSQLMFLMLHFFLFFPRLAGFSGFVDGARLASGSGGPSDNSLWIPWINSLRYST